MASDSHQDWNVDSQPSVLRAVEFYSGIGGLHLSLRRSGIPGAVAVAAYDWDQTACQVYAANFGSDIIHKTDITTLTAESLSRLNADLWLLSPSCQPYTVLNPSAKGAADPRAQSFLHLIDKVLPQLCAEHANPRYLLVENVAGFQDSTTRRHLVSTLRKLGYATVEFTLNPLQFGIPNSRLRYYLLAKLSPLKFVGIDSTRSNLVLDYIPSHHTSDPSIDTGRVCNGSSHAAPLSLREYVDWTMDEKMTAQFRIPERVLNKWGRLFDIVSPSSTRSCCFTRGYTQLVERAGSILQMNENLDTTQTFNAFLDARADGNNNALLRLFQFTDPASSFDFAWPPSVSTRSKYRLIGNSVNVEVVRRLVVYLFTEK